MRVWAPGKAPKTPPASSPPSRRVAALGAPPFPPGAAPKPPAAVEPPCSTKDPALHRPRRLPPPSDPPSPPDAPSAAVAAAVAAWRPDALPVALQEAAQGRLRGPPPSTPPHPPSSAAAAPPAPPPFPPPPQPTGCRWNRPTRSASAARSSTGSPTASRVAWPPRLDTPSHGGAADRAGDAARARRTRSSPRATPPTATAWGLHEATHRVPQPPPDPHH